MPFALFGFSFGALIMYHVALTLQAEGHAPLLLGVAARVAPPAMDIAASMKAGLRHAIHMAFPGPVEYLPLGHV